MRVFWAGFQQFFALDRNCMGFVSGVLGESFGRKFWAGFGRVWGGFGVGFGWVSVFTLGSFCP